jgi:hypothetical protein
MKKYLLLLLCTVAIGLSSCKKETILEPSNRTILVDVFANQWRTDDGGFTYYTNIDVPENDASFNQIGHIVVAMSFENVNEYEGLPQVYNGLSYQFQSGIGYVRLVVSSPNSGTTINAPNFDATAKITLIDALLID